MYARKDIFNDYKCGLMYQMDPVTTVALTALIGQKMQKNRIEVYVCINADGFEKYELILIGYAERSSPFKKKYGHEIGLKYHFKERLG